MTLNIHLTITPSTETSAALAQAHKEQQNTASTEGSTPRRLKYEWQIPGTSSTLDIVRIEADGKGQSAVYHCIGHPGTASAILVNTSLAEIPCLGTA